MGETTINISIASGEIDVEGVERGAFRGVFSAGIVQPDAAMYILFGDLHGNIRAAQTLAVRLQHAFECPASAVFQVGDFGYWPSRESAQYEDEFYKESDALDFANLISQATERFALGSAPLDELRAPFYFIRGNHEDLVTLSGFDRALPTVVAPGFWYVPDEYVGELAGIRVLAMGGILRDTARGRGKRNKRQRKAAKKAVDTDARFNDAAQLELPSVPIQMLLTHSGPASREKRHGSVRLDRILSSGKAPVHFYGHHHRFSLESKSATSVSVGLRNLAVSRGRLLGGGVAVLRWCDGENFDVLVHEPPLSASKSISKLSMDS